MGNVSMYLATGALIALLAGCAGAPNTADIMRAHADEAQARVDLKKQLAKDWRRGATLVQTGEKRVRSGEKKISAAERDLREGRDQVERGNQEIAEGRALMQESEQRFHENFPDLQFRRGN